MGNKGCLLPVPMICLFIEEETGGALGIRSGAEVVDALGIPYIQSEHCRPLTVFAASPKNVVGELSVHTEEVEGDFVEFVLIVGGRQEAKKTEPGTKHITTRLVIPHMIEDHVGIAAGIHELSECPGV